jgi:hypothetical protein
MNFLSYEQKLSTISPISTKQTITSHLKSYEHKNIVCLKFRSNIRGCHGCDRMVVGFTTTCVISAYHH